MHQYKIEIYTYTEQGAVGPLETTEYCDTPERAQAICRQYERMRQENGMKAYRAELYLQCYKLCGDKNAFFAQFQV